MATACVGDCDAGGWGWLPLPEMSFFEWLPILTKDAHWVCQGGCR